MKSKRFEVLDARPVNQDGYVQEGPEVGLIAMNSPFDPKPSIKIENGVITELDGKTRAECLMRLRRALDEMVVDGIETTLPLFRDLVREDDIINGDYHIHWLEQYLAGKTNPAAK